MVGASDGSTSKPWGPGLVLSERYQLIELMGAGAMGEVWRAEHLAIGKHVAVKVIDTERCANPEETLARFRREARAAAALKTQHVVAVHDQGTHGRIGYIVMELLEGESVEQRLGRRGPVSPAQCARIMAEACVALGMAHDAGILHRDLKPANMFLARADGREVVKLLDFGLAKLLHGSQSFATCTSTTFGTPAYMSPEQVTASHSVDHRSDLWSLGVITFELLTARLPFDGDTVRDLLMRIVAAPIPVPSSVASVPAGFDAWFARATARDPAERFQSARELSAALAVALQGPDVVVTVGTEADADTTASTTRFPGVLDDAAPDGRASAGAPSDREALASTATALSGSHALEQIQLVASCGKQTGPLAWEATKGGAGRARSVLLVMAAVAAIGAAGMVAWVTMRAPNAGGATGAVATAEPPAPVSLAAPPRAPAPLAPAGAAGSSAPLVGASAAGPTAVNASASAAPSPAPGATRLPRPVPTKGDEERTVDRLGL